MPSSLLVVSRSSELQRAELSRVYPDGNLQILSPNLILGTALNPGHLPILALSSQLLPDPIALNAESINGWATAIRSKLEESSGPIRLHILASPLPNTEMGTGRARLVEETLIEQLKKRSRSLLRRLQVNSEHPFSEDESFVQVILFSTTSGMYSLADPSQIRALSLSPYRYGELEVPEDKRPPARAYRKLVEALTRSGLSIKPGERAVDLGASPGSWSYIALEQGARVTAVDRSPLREDLMRRVDFIDGDGFQFTPKGEIDWLLCDIIAFPKRSIDLLEQWLQKRWCKNFCVTIKFRGDEDYIELENLKTILQRECSYFLLRQLTANKNEVTAIGVRR